MGVCCTDRTSIDLTAYGAARLDPVLITALVERWRQETHTFHLPIGEVTITLQDVAVLWGLPIDDISGGSLRIGWITEHFTELPDDPSDDLVVQFARAHMLHLIGGIMLPDKMQNKVQLMFLPLLEHLDQIHTYSWGSACLARLYRDLCRASSPDTKDIGGASVLLQLWAWERLPRLAPHLPPGVVADGFEPIMIDAQNSLPPRPHGCRWGVEHRLKNTPNHMVVAFRDQLDQLRADEFIWQPYSDDLIGRLPEYYRQGMELWRTRSPLICFDVLEWHFPDRVLRQFGFRQSIPEHCHTDERLHKVDRRGKPETRCICYRW
ncbi:hypothetical protein L1049_001056 [Liquidambar formosana]|uniref:Aminotransferase-like plant mobile domain-containing protein n=1 Tax=Liquidambar formosana TaxID=63359 RepID=A0AAP0NC58_LIQFO